VIPATVCQDFESFGEFVQLAVPSSVIARRSVDKYNRLTIASFEAFK